MQCPHCKGSVSTYNFFFEKLCPACGEQLKKMPTKDQIKEFLIAFSEDTGYVFWSVVYLISIWVIAFVEQILGKGEIFDYITNHNIRFFFLAVFSGSIIDYFAKANVEVTAVRNKFIFRPPAFLRKFRRWTNIFLVLGFVLSYYVNNRWPGYIGVLPTYTFIISFLLCLVWAIAGIFINEDDMKDKRIQYFMQEMRVDRIRIYNRVSAIYIAGIFISSISFYWLVNISGLWFYISNSRFVYDITTFLRMYFSWVLKFID